MNLLLNILAAAWSTLLEMAPYLLFGFFCAGVLSVIVSADKIKQHLGKPGFASVLKASLFGIPLPLCSCGVIPVAASLHRNGASRGATAAFLLSTPQTGVDSFFVVFSLLGATFAFFGPVAALVSGVIVGLLVGLTKGGTISEPEKSCCGSKSKAEETAQPPVWKRALTHGFITLAADIAIPLLIGLLLAGVFEALVPANYFEGHGSGIVAKLIMLSVGIPLYVCASASAPMAAAFIAGGISPGTAFVFLMSGPATNLATVTTMGSLLGKKAMAMYVVGVGICALIAGTLLDQLYQRPDIAAPDHVHDALPEALRITSAVILVAVVFYAKWGRKWLQRKTT